MSWILFLYAFTMGVEQNNLLAPEPDWYAYTQFETSVLLWNRLELGGSSALYAEMAKPPWFNPVEGDFAAFARLRFGLLTIEYNHLCIHSFMGGGYMPGGRYARDGMASNRLTLIISNRKSD